MILLIIQIAGLVVLGFLLAYLCMLSVLSLFAPFRVPGQPRRRRRFAVVVPAHNEETCVGATVRSVLGIDYPSSFFDVLVIADNCDDRTADIAAEEGALVLVRRDADRRSKGHALAWAFERIVSRSGGYDAVVVIDADTTVDRNLLLVANDYLERGAKAVQCNDQVKPQPGAWSAESIRLGLALYNYVRPMGRKVLRCPPGLRGNGMCFDVETLRRVPWRAFSRAEDLEYGLELLMKGVRVVFAPEALVLATMTRDSRNAETQRARWEGGRFPMVRRFAFPLLRTAIAHQSFAALDALIDLVTPPLVNLVLLSTAIGVFALVLGLFGMDSMLRIAGLWCVVTSLGVLHAMIGWYVAGVDLPVFALLRHVPRYAFWKIRLYARLLRKGQSQEWIRTTRETARVGR